MQNNNNKEKSKEGRDKEMVGKEESLPPGFRFHPTDEELITAYLINKISDPSFSARAITDVDLNKCEPWELPGKAKMGEKEWYFFSVRDRKYPTGVRTNRATNTGYWKTTGKDKEISNSSNPSELVGMKKTLVFYKGRAPRGEKSNWVMHEYRIHSKSSFRPNKQDEWVVCRVFQKSGGAKKYPSSNHHHARGPTGVVNLAVNPYNLEIGSAMGMGMGPSIMPHHQIQYHHHHVGLGDPNSSHFLNLYGRNYTNNNNNNMSPTAELAEIARVFRANNNGVTTTSTTSPLSSTTLPMQHLNYPPPPAAFTISGLNLNLGGAGAGAGATALPLFRPMNPHDVASNMMTAGTSLSGAENVGYGNNTAEMSNPNPNPNIAPNNRYMGMDHCVDLENYWPSY